MFRVPFPLCFTNFSGGVRILVEGWDRQVSSGLKIRLKSLYSRPFCFSNDLRAKRLPPKEIILRENTGEEFLTRKERR